MDFIEPVPSLWTGRYHVGHAIAVRGHRRSPSRGGHVEHPTSIRRTSKSPCPSRSCPSPYTTGWSLSILREHLGSHGRLFYVCPGLPILLLPTHFPKFEHKPYRWDRQVLKHGQRRVASRRPQDLAPLPISLFKQGSSELNLSPPPLLNRPARLYFPRYFPPSTSCLHWFVLFFLRIFSIQLFIVIDLLLMGACCDYFFLTSICFSKIILQKN